MKILGLSCSLRNARYGAGSAKLIEEIKAIDTEEDLVAYLERQTKIRADDFLRAGRQDKVPFDIIYANLQKARGDRGLSNSEAILVAGLWGAHQRQAEIAHCGLSAYFPMNGPARNLHLLRQQVLEADALMLSGPVYFGDRGSLAQAFFEFLREDKECAAHIRDRLYAGVTVGAKRNGGQETTLIYQMVDATNLNMLAVGNDSETTSQYGGTAHAGDVGTAWKDDYGIKTSIGTGRRLASVGLLMERADNNKLIDKVKIAVWLLQDTPDHRGRGLIERFCRDVEATDDRIDMDVRDYTEEVIYRCIACDICPTSVGPRDEYRCIINAEHDLFKRHHQDMIEPDAILLAAYSPVDRSKINSIYQRFVERTRYLRRDDYVLGERLSAPFVISEINSNQNLHIRMLTSLVRHHTVLHHPLIGMELDGEMLNWEELVANGVGFARNAMRLTTGRLASPAEDVAAQTYNPVGYSISAEKQREDIASGKSAAAAANRHADHATLRKRRIS